MEYSVFNKLFKKFHKFKLFDFLVSGLQIRTSFFVDFTNSKVNKDFSNNMNNFQDKKSELVLLHEIIIKQFLVYLNTDNKFLSLGFGCMLPESSNSVVNCFSLTGNIMNPNVIGEDGLLESINIS